MMKKIASLIMLSCSLHLIADAPVIGDLSVERKIAQNIQALETHREKQEQFKSAEELSELFEQKHTFKKPKLPKLTQAQKNIPVLAVTESLYADARTKIDQLINRKDTYKKAMIAAAVGAAGCAAWYYFYGSTPTKQEVPVQDLHGMKIAIESANSKLDLLVPKAQALSKPLHEIGFFERRWYDVKNVFGGVVGSIGANLLLGIIPSPIRDGYGYIQRAYATVCDEVKLDWFLKNYTMLKKKENFFVEVVRAADLLKESSAEEAEFARYTVITAVNGLIQELVHVGAFMEWQGLKLIQKDAAIGHHALVRSYEMKKAIAAYTQDMHEVIENQALTVVERAAALEQSTTVLLQKSIGIDNSFRLYEQTVLQDLHNLDN